MVFRRICILASVMTHLIMAGVHAGEGSRPTPAQSTEQVGKLDSMLKAIEKRTRVVNGLTAVTIAELEDRIIVLDSRLSSARTIAISEAQLRALLEQRVLLMDALVNTHAKRTVNVGF